MSVLATDPFASAFLQPPPSPGFTPPPTPPPGAPTFIPPGTATPPGSITRQQTPNVARGPMTPMPNAPPVPPAVAASQRKNQKTDAKRRQGTALRQAAVDRSGTNSTTDAPPQMATPPPAVSEQQTPFTPAQYKPPNKGLEYLAMGIGLLFPGAPIARAAAGFLGGMNQGAQQGYERNEQQAETQYRTQQEAAKVKFDNDNAVRQAALDQQNTVFQNQKLQYELQTLPQRQNGIDPKTGKPFILPPQLQRILPPGTKRPVGATDLASHAAALAQFYTSVGATNKASQYDAEAKAYNQRAVDDANNTRQLQEAALREQEADRRTFMQQEGADRREVSREAAADYRESVRIAHEDWRATRGNPATLQPESLKAGQEFYAAWAKATKPPTDANGDPRYKKDQNGTVVLDPNGKPMPQDPEILPQRASALGHTFSRIDKFQDPAGLAQAYSETVSSPVEKQLILARGRAAALSRRSQGLPIRPAPSGFYDYVAKGPAADVLLQERGAAAPPAATEVSRAVAALKSMTPQEQAYQISQAETWTDPEKDEIRKQLGLPTLTSIESAQPLPGPQPQF